MSAPVLDTRLSRDDAAFAANAAHNRALASQLRDKVAAAMVKYQLDPSKPNPMSV